MDNKNETKRPRSIALIFVGKDMENESNKADKIEIAKIIAEEKKLDVVKELEDLSKEEFLTELHDFLVLPPKRKHLFYIGRQNGFSCNDEMVSASVVLATILTSEELVEEGEDSENEDKPRKLPPKQNTTVLKFHLFSEYSKDWYSSHAEYMKLQNMYAGPAVMVNYISDKKAVGLKTSTTAV